MNCWSFWEQFNDVIHSKLQLYDPVKLAYLRQAPKNGPVRHAIKGLSGMASNYREAITILQEHYGRPHLLLQAHLHTTIEAPSLKEGSRQELRCLHDVLLQHLWVVKVMDNESSPFVTSLIELKLDQVVAFEW